MIKKKTVICNFPHILWKLLINTPLKKKTIIFKKQQNIKIKIKNSKINVKLIFSTVKSRYLLPESWISIRFHEYFRNIYCKA